MTDNMDMKLIELHIAYREVRETLAKAAVAYDKAHMEARIRADERGEDTPKSTGNPAQDHINARPFDEAWGILDLRNAYDAADVRYDEILMEICSTPASGVSGILIKLEMWNSMETVKHSERLELGNIDLDEDLILIAALRDARKLCPFMVEPHDISIKGARKQ